MVDDRQLLVQYVSEGSEEAFTEIVRRYTPLVYSAALRRIGGNSEMTKDATQLVFATLARKARSLPKGVVLAGWLHEATRFAAAQLLRVELRRRAREQEVFAMSLPQSEAMPLWQQIRPILDEALDQLRRKDRDALLLRFFEQQDYAAVGAALGTTAEAARKRVDRALEHLRKCLRKRKITTSAAALGATLSVNALEFVPTGIASSLATSSAAAAVAAVYAPSGGFLSLILTAKAQLAVVTVAVTGVATTSLLLQGSPAKARAQQPAGSGNPPVTSTETRVAQLAPQTNSLPGTNASSAADKPEAGEMLRVGELRDVGTATPAALFQTFLWAVPGGDTNRIAQLLVIEPGTDMAQRFLEELRERGSVGRAAVEASSPTAAWKILEVTPAENDDRWVPAVLYFRNGNTARIRTRVRRATDGWKFVVGDKYPLLQQKMDETTGQWHEVWEIATSAEPRAAGEILHIEDLREVGTPTPAALFQTYLWGIHHGDTNRLRSLVTHDADTVFGIENGAVTPEFLKEFLTRASLGLTNVLASAPAVAWRILEDTPAGHDERWLPTDLYFGNGNTVRIRTRVLSTSSGWKFVVGDKDNPLVQQQLDQATGQWGEVRLKEVN